MAWIRVDQSLRDHRKLIALANELGIGAAAATGHLVLLWLWCLDNAPDGKLTRIDPAIMGEAAQYHVCADGTNRGSATFLEALVACGWVDKRGHGTDRPPDFQIHNWEEYGGKLLQSRDRHREVVRQSRDRLDQSRSDQSRREKIRVEKKPPPTPSDDPAALTMDHEGEIRMEDDEYDPETLQQDLNALFPEGWKVKAHA